MDIRMQIQSTPNPNALKFVVNTPVKTEGKATFKSASDSTAVPVAQALFSIPHVHEVYFFDNYITVTQDGNGDWDAMEQEIQKIILEKLPAHDPNFQVSETAKTIERKSDNPEIAKIEAILDNTIRPALQMDGGDILVTSLEGNVLQVHYQGACGSCPSSAMGTLKAIEGILKDEYNPEITVELAQGAGH